MKILLACLMCFVLTLSQTFAIDGGPFGGAGQVRVTGTYAGVFIPVPTVFDPGPPPVMLTDNSLALFTLKIPKQGPGTGTVAVFRSGKAYTGDIQAFGDPDTSSVSGVISAIHTQTVTGGSTTVTIIFTDLANGTLKAKAKASGTTNSGGVRLIGAKSSISYTTPPANPDQTGNSGGPIFYKIRGFKQAEASS